MKRARRVASSTASQDVNAIGSQAQCRWYLTHRFASHDASSRLRTKTDRLGPSCSAGI